MGRQEALLRELKSWGRRKFGDLEKEKKIKQRLKEI